MHHSHDEEAKSWTSRKNIIRSTACTLTGLLQLTVTVLTYLKQDDIFWHNQDIMYDFRAQLEGTGSRSEI